MDNKVFGRLTLIREAGRDKSRAILWECKCSCGNTHTTTKSLIVRGVTKSCGCLRKETPKTHGLSNHPSYGAFTNAKQRCQRKSNTYWEDYGGRGIKFKLGSMQEFVQYMGNTWFEGATLDRKDNNGHYEYGNIRWATQKEQASNRRSNTMITYCMVTLTLTDWARELGLSTPGFAKRVKRWGIERAITTPPRR